MHLHRTIKYQDAVHEYCNSDATVIVFAHEGRKGQTIWDYWFYGGYEASSGYVWFYSVQELVRRAIDEGGIDVADLGSSDCDAFSNLKN